MNKLFSTIALALTILMLTFTTSANAQKKVNFPKTIFTERHMPVPSVKKAPMFASNKIKFNFVVKHTSVVPEAYIQFRDPKYKVKITKRDTMYIDTVSIDRNRIHTVCKKEGITYYFVWLKKSSSDEFYYLDPLVSAVGTDFKVSKLKVQTSETCKLKYSLLIDNSGTDSNSTPTVVETVEKNE